MPAKGATRRRRSESSSERRAYRKQPRQERARATVDVILSAARRVLAQTGYAKFTTNKVAKIAGVSIGSLYQYFPSKRALVGAVFEDHVERKTAEFRAERRALAQLPVEGVIRRMAEWMVESHREDPVLHRILTEELPRHGLSPKIAAGYEQAIAGTSAYLRYLGDEIAPRDHDLSAFMIIHTMEALTKAALVRDPAMLNAELIDAITTMVMNYLKPQPASAVRPRSIPA